MRLSSRPRLAAVVSLLALAACGGDGPTSQSAAPIPPAGSAGGDVELHSLFGAATPQVLAAIDAQRAALDRAADAALAGDGAPAALDAFVFAPFGGASRTTTLRTGVQSFPIHFHDTKTEQVGPPNDRRSVTTTSTMDATLVNGTLTVISTDRYVARAIQAPDATHPSASLVSETRRELVISACPDAAGVGAGHWTSSEATWMAGSDATALANAANFDAMQEVTAEGTTAVHVRDDAEIEGYDLDLRVSLRKARSADNRPLDKRGTVRMRQTGVAPASLLQWRDDAMLSDKTGDYDMLEALDVTPVAFHAGFKQRLKSTYGRARTEWRGGTCIEVVPARGATGGAFAGGATVSLGPEARHRIDRSTVAPATFAAVPSRGIVAAPAAGVPHPATFAFTMPAQGGARVTVTATSRRGIGLGEVLFLGSESGSSIDYQSTTTYQLDSDNGYGERTTGQALGEQRLRSRLTLVPREPMEEWDIAAFDVVTTTEFVISASGTVATRDEDGSFSGDASFRIAGAGTTRNPSGTTGGDYYSLAPERHPEVHDTAGVLRLYRRGGRDLYDLDIGFAQIIPEFEASGRMTLTCRDADVAPPSTRRIQFNSRAGRYDEEESDPGDCWYVPTNSHAIRPYTFGALGLSRMTLHPVSGSAAMFTGAYDPKSGVIEGEETVTITACPIVEGHDPLQLATVIHRVIVWNGDLDLEGGSCRLQYTVRWRFEVPRR